MAAVTAGDQEKEDDHSNMFKLVAGDDELLCWVPDADSEATVAELRTAASEDVGVTITAVMLEVPSQGGTRAIQLADEELLTRFLRAGDVVRCVAAAGPPDFGSHGFGCENHLFDEKVLR